MPVSVGSWLGSVGAASHRSELYGVKYASPGRSAAGTLAIGVCWGFVWAASEVFRRWGLPRALRKVKRC
ncbi:hypothetical protein N7493_006754 [Penicillium malachiteum]|uniref:Uncharacterized protein n=1 Tax=Penicillium malachiteum TaxID=1324776 RepID=A0AAD6MUX5_9EURO|nr:hypothetical protein N7493_006754 [Penicillium malachiteum]